MKFIQSVAEKQRVQIKVFKGAVIFECCILSPVEAEAAGLSSSLIASALLDPMKIMKMQKQKQKLETMNLEDPSEEDIQQLLNMVHGVDPQKLLAIEDHQNKILMQVVKRASEDQGKTFEDIFLVAGEQQQDPNHNRLWVGTLSTIDRKEILDKVMNGHKEVADHLQNFRSAR